MPKKNTKKGWVRTPKHMWTKDEILKVIKLWNSKTTNDLAKELNVATHQIQALATQIRKSGYALPRKLVKGRLRSLIEEVTRGLK